MSQSKNTARWGALTLSPATSTWKFPIKTSSKAPRSCSPTSFNLNWSCATRNKNKQKTQRNVTLEATCAFLLGFGTVQYYLFTVQKNIYIFFLLSSYSADILSFLLVPCHWFLLLLFLCHSSAILVTFLSFFSLMLFQLTSVLLF